MYQNKNFKIFFTKYLREKPGDLAYVITTSGILFFTVEN